MQKRRFTVDNVIKLTIAAGSDDDEASYTSDKDDEERIVGLPKKVQN
jgi:hypothetical protein